jgi:hypothetical protein
MKRMLEVCLAAVALATVASSAEGSSFGGTWEGQLQGIKAVTLEIQDEGTIVAGIATFYVIKDEGEGKRIGGATRAAMEHVRLRDAILEFDVTVPGGDNVVHFRMTLNGSDAAELKREAPELTVVLHREVRI